MGNFKVCTTFNKSLGQTAPSAWKCLKTQFWGPLTENFNPLQRPTHILTSSSINTQNRSKNHGWIYHGMHWTQHYKQKLYISHWKARIWLPMAFKTIPDTPAEATEPSFRKVSPPPAKLRILFPAHLWVREFWPQIYSLWQSLDWGLLSNILASMKMGRA